MRRTYLGDGAGVAAAAGAFCVVGVLLPSFFDRFRFFAAFLRWIAGLTTVTVLPLPVIVSSYGVGRLRGSGPPPVMTPALPLPMPLPAVLPVVPVPVICPFASPQMKGPTQTPTKMICRSLDKFIVISIEQGASYTAATRHLHFFIERDTVYACRISSADLARIAIRKKSRWRLWVTIIGLIYTPPSRPQSWFQPSHCGWFPA